MVKTITPDDSDEESTTLEPLPDGTKHVIVAKHPSFMAAAPEGHPDDTLLYEVGDEVPRAVAEEHYHDHTASLMAVDGNGQPIAGGEGDSVDPREAVREWGEGGFDPSEYGDGDGDDGDGD
jgi:hypothetical protein